MATVLKIIICHNFSGFSYADTSKQLAIKLALEGHNVIFFSHSLPDEIPVGISGLQIMRWPEKRPTGFASFKAIYQTICKQKTDVLLAHTAALNISGLAARIAGVKKIIGYYHSSYESTLIDNQSNPITLYFQRFRKKMFYKCFHQMICVSAFAAKDIQRWFGYPKEKTIVIHNALRDRFHFTESLQHLEKRPIIFFSAGRLDPGKNIKRMSEGFILFAQKHSGNTKLIIAGDGPMAGEIKKLSLTNGAVEYLGLVPYEQIDHYIQSSHVMVCSTLAEAFGMTVIEAMMNHTPVIASNIGGIRELVENGHQGWLVDGATAEIWQIAFEKIYNFITESPTQFASVGKNGRDTFLKNYQLEMQLHKLFTLINTRE